MNKETVIKNLKSIRDSYRKTADIAHDDWPLQKYSRSMSQVFDDVLAYVKNPDLKPPLRNGQWVVLLWEGEDPELVRIEGFIDSEGMEVESSEDAYLFLCTMKGSTAKLSKRIDNEDRTWKRI